MKKEPARFGPSNPVKSRKRRPLFELPAGANQKQPAGNNSQLHYPHHPRTTGYQQGENWHHKLFSRDARIYLGAGLTWATDLREECHVSSDGTETLMKSMLLEPLKATTNHITN